MAARLAAALLASLVLAGLPAGAAAQGPARATGGPTVSDFATGLDQPWALAFLPGGGALVTEREGRVLRLGADGAVGPAVLDLRGQVGGGEGGALGLAVDPEFARTRFVFLYRTQATPLVNQVVRYRLREDAAALVEPRVVADGIPAFTIHNGGRIRFGPDGLLYISTGDAASDDAGKRRAQDPGSLAGKMLRLPPAAYRGDGARPEVVTLGHRNPQGFDWQPGSGLLYGNEHGPSGNDEVNRLVERANYGWPDAVGPGHPAPFRSPLATYSTIAPSGATFVHQGGSSWSGDYLVGALRGQQIRRLRFDGDRVLIDEPLFAGQFGRVRVVVEGPDGALYAATGNGNRTDVIKRIVPPAGPPGQPGPGGGGGGAGGGGGQGSGSGGGGGGATGTAPETGALARLSRVTEVDTHRGLTAWSAYDPAIGAYRLMLREAGALGVAAAVAPRAAPFDVDLGTDARGRTVAVYSRCATEPTRHGAGGTLLRATGRGCDLFALDPATGAERRVAGASTAAASELLPSVSGGRIAFARVFERRAGRRGDLPYLYVRSGGRSVRVPGGGRGASGLPGPTGVDLAGRRLAFTWELREGLRLRSELRLATLGGTRRVLERAGSARHPANVFAPALAGGHVLAGLRRVRGAAATSRVVRHRATGGGRALARPALPGMLVGLGHDGTRTVAATAADALAAPRCAAGAAAVQRPPACTVLELGALRFAR